MVYQDHTVRVLIDRLATRSNDLKGVNVSVPDQLDGNNALYSVLTEPWDARTVVPHDGASLDCHFVAKQISYNTVAATQAQKPMNVIL